jgi:hypothetical protein
MYHEETRLDVKDWKYYLDWDRVEWCAAVDTVVNV